MNAPAKRRGAPALPYNAEIAEEILAEYASTDKGLVAILDELPDAPCYRTVMKWLNSNAEFDQAFARAKQLKADFLAGQIIDIADEPNGDAVIAYNPDGRPYAKMDGTNVRRSEVMIKARQWVAAKFNPRGYGDSIDVTSKGEALAAPVINQVTIDQRVQTLMLLAAQRKADEEEAARLLE